MTIDINNKKFKRRITVFLAMLTAMSPMAIDTYLSAMPVMADFYNVNIGKVEFSLTLYFLGFAVGNFIGGPLSDSFGRKKAASFGAIVYMIAAFCIPFSPSIEYVWVLRFLQAFGGGFASVVAMVFVKDWYTGKEVARVGTIISMIMMLAPLFAPMLGGAILQLGSWKHIFFMLGTYGLLIFVLFTFFMPESRDASLIDKKVVANRFVKNYVIFFSSRRAVFMLLATSFAASAMFTFLTSASFIYIEYFGYTETSFPLLFGANVVLNIILSFLSTKLLRWKAPHQLLQIGLLIQLVGGLLILYAVLAEPIFILVFLSIVLVVGSLGMIFGNGVAIILNELPQISGAANATIGVVRFVVSFVISSIPALFHTGDLVPAGIVIFVCALLGNLFFVLFNSSSRRIVPTSGK